jgi:hypothetical protein
MNEQFATDIIKVCEPLYKCISNELHPSYHSCDNALLFTSTYVALNPNDTTYWCDYFIPFMQACQVPNQRGLYYRYPGVITFNEFDDLTGISVACNQIGYNLDAIAILEHGRKNLYFWNNLNPGVKVKEAFFGRIPSFVAGLKAAAGEKLNLFDVLYTAIAYIYDAYVDKQETNGRCMLYLRQKVLRGKSMLLDLALAFWRKRMIKLYPDGMKGVYRIYFGPEHPFTIHGPGDFE